MTWWGWVLVAWTAVALPAAIWLGVAVQLSERRDVARRRRIDEEFERMLRPLLEEDAGRPERRVDVPGDDRRGTA
ncbi:hypothetical protein [Modestobacter versicolor]|uniref:hypothetical protein n=1 Tax=Modestobacter versicolor TaxID=429133 RepID=UPI0034DECDCD